MLSAPPRPFGVQKHPHCMNFYHSSSSPSPTTPPMMNHSNPPNHPIYPCFQLQQTTHYEEQYLPSTSRSTSYVSNPTHPSTPYTQDHVVNYNHEQTIGSMVNDRGQLSIPFERLNQQTNLESLATMDLKEIIFLGPQPNSMVFFQNSRDMVITRVILYLECVRSVEKITFPLDFAPDLTRILETLAGVHGVQEIELILPAFTLERHSMDMIYMQHAFIRGLDVFNPSRLKRLTIPMEFVSALLLSYLAILPNLEYLTVNYSPPPRTPHHQQQFPVWSSHTIPSECPGYVFLAHLKFDPRRYFFKKLLRLDLRAPISDASYTTLRTLFPKTYIHCGT